MRDAFISGENFNTYSNVAQALLGVGTEQLGPWLTHLPSWPDLLVGTPDGAAIDAVLLSRGQLVAVVKSRRPGCYDVRDTLWEETRCMQEAALRRAARQQWARAHWSILRGARGQGVEIMQLSGAVA